MLKALGGNHMQFHISDDAIAWYEEELHLHEGDSVRFLARYGGNSTHHAGFSLGIEKENPISAGVSFHKNGIHYFIEENDLWYFNDQDLFIQFNSEINEPVYILK